MLTFCTWHDEDGTHYGVTRVDPHKYFCWRGWRQCTPKYCEVSAVNCKQMVQVLPGYTIDDDFMEVDICDWDIYFSLKGSLRTLR